MNKLCSAFLTLLVCQISFGVGHGKKLIILEGRYYSRINDTLYAAICETNNEDYNKFLSQIPRGTDPGLYQSCMYDSTDWITRFPYLKDTALRNHYHNHAAFNNFPIVDIPWYGAVQYCQWLSRRTDSAHINSRKHYVFTLPTEEEWMMMANGNADGFPSGFNQGKDSYGRYKENINTFDGNYDTIAVDGGYFTVAVDAYWPDKHGFFNIVGNVAEMTSQKDLTKGGSWWSQLADCAFTKIEEIQTPDPRVGFRVFVRVFSR